MATIAKTKQLVRMPRFGHRVDKTDPIMRGCVGWWPLNDGAGTKAKDIASDSYSGTLSASVTWDSTSLGTAPSWPGSDIDSDLGATWTDLGITGGTTFSSSVWVYPTAPGGYVDNRGYIYADGNPPALGWRVYKTSGTVNLWINSTAITLAGALTIDAWNHVCHVLDGTNSIFYVNGTAIDTSSFSDALTASGLVNLGNYSTTSRPFAGNIQNLRFYNRALTATEVSRLYSEPWAGLEPLSPFSFFSGLSQVYAYYSAAFLQRL